MAEEQKEQPIDLEQRLEAEKKRSEDYLTRLKYLQVDFENLKKRYDRQMEETKSYCTERLVIQLLDVQDELEMALKNAQSAGSAQTLIEGVQMSDSFIIDDDNRSHLSAEFQHLPNGTWMVEYLIEDDGLWAKLNSEKLNGFSVEGTFYYGNIQK